MSNANDKISRLNSAKRLPILFCLDVSPSMGYHEGNNSSSMELLNVAVASFMQQLREHPKIKMAAEIAYVTFSTGVVSVSDFQPVVTMKTPVFQPVARGGTHMAEAVIRSIEIIESRLHQLENSSIGCYAPFLVLITDGNPDGSDSKVRQEQAINLIRQHCDFNADPSKIIVPFIIGVGDLVDKKTLNSYASGFTRGYFPIRGSDNMAQMQFNRVFQLIGNSARTSVKLSREVNEVLNTIRSSMNSVLDELSNV